VAPSNAPGGCVGVCPLAPGGNTGEDGGEQLTGRVKWNNQSGSDSQPLAFSLKG